jgi:hypothetical protein
MHEPQSSGGYTYYTGSRNGGSQSYPTDGTYNFPPTYLDPGNTAWSAGQQAFYPYSEYQYPHPLQVGP